MNSKFCEAVASAFTVVKMILQLHKMIQSDSNQFNVFLDFFILNWRNHDNIYFNLQ